MEQGKLICATIGVANRTVIAGQQTRENVGSKNGPRLRTTASFTFLGYLIMAGLLLTQRPIPARADDFQELSRGGWGEGKDVRAEIGVLREQIESLRAAVAALKSLVKTLQTSDTTTLQNQINSLQASNTALQKQLAAVLSNPALDLGPYVRVNPIGEADLSGPQIIFTGANIQIESGQGSTYDGSGLGNLIIGYNEFPNDSGPIGPHQRIGAHNLVIGPGHRYTGDGGLVAGRLNTISGEGATVTGGSGNVASGSVASVSGGSENLASGDNASISGGGSNTASDLSSVSGGNNNIASGLFSSVSGGENNVASGLGASVSGGAGNTGGGRDMVIIGGQNVNDFIDFTIQPKAPFP
jgi:hypothetical protein